MTATQTEIDAAKLYYWLAYVIRWHDRLTPGDFADAKKVLAEFAEHAKFKGYTA
jgi:hypothetical protein